MHEIHFDECGLKSGNVLSCVVEIEHSETFDVQVDNISTSTNSPKWFSFYKQVVILAHKAKHNP